jgi:WhiB family redox-sensing transcriptional regulator
MQEVNAREWWSLTPPAAEDSEWMREANCKGLDTELFFPERGKGRDPMIVKVCDACPVKQECRDYADKYIMDGIWGGTGAVYRMKQRNISTPQG